MTTPSACFDKSFLNPKLSVSLAAGLSEASRKMQIFNQAGLYPYAQLQATRRAVLLAYAERNYGRLAPRPLREAL